MQVAGLDEVSITVSLSDRTATLSLTSLRRTLAQHEPARHAAVIARFARLSVVGLSGGGGRGVLLPRPAAPGDARSLSAPWFVPLADGVLWLTLVEDRGEVLRFVRPMDFVRWRLSVAAARQEALTTLHAWSEGRAPEPVGEGVFRFATGDGLDAARMLVLSRWFDGPVYALPVSRDQLWVTPDADRAAAIHPLIGPSAHRLPHPVSDRLFVCLDGEIRCV